MKGIAKKYAKILSCIPPDFSDASKWGKVSEVVEDMIVDLEDRLEDLKKARTAKYFDEEADEGEEDELDEKDETPKDKADTASLRSTVLTQFFEKKFADKDADAGNMTSGVDEIDCYYKAATETQNKHTLKKMLKNMQKVASYTASAWAGEGKGGGEKKRKRESSEDEDEEVSREELEEELADLTNNEPTEDKKEIYYDFVDSSEDDEENEEQED